MRCVYFGELKSILLRRPLMQAQAHLVVNKRCLVSWPEALVQQRLSGGAEVKWVELGQINCRCVRSWQLPLPITSGNLLGGSATLSWLADRCTMECRIQASFTHEEQPVFRPVGHYILPKWARKQLNWFCRRKSVFIYVPILFFSADFQRIQ